MKLSRIQHQIKNSAMSALLLLWLIPAAEASTLLIPKSQQENLQAPAIDLVYKGQPLDRDQVVDLIDSGQDISRIDPAPSDVWTPAALPASDGSSQNYPPEEVVFDFDSDITASRGMFRARLLGPGAVPFRLVLSLDSHAALMRSALLRRLGYTVDAPKAYRSLTVRFRDIATRERFLDQLSDRTLTARSRWIEGSLSPSDPQVTLRDAVLEPGRIQIPPYHWGVVSGAHLKGRRVLRALIVPFVLLDVPESINLYAWEPGKELSKHVSLTHPYADSFSETTFDDARWIVRKIAELKPEDLKTIVAAGRYPAPVTTLILEKLTARRNNLVRLFELRGEIPKAMREFAYRTDIHFPPDVLKGKLVRETYEGYALRFTYGDPESPLRKDELGRYLRLELISGAIRALTQKVNEALEARGPADIAKKHSEDLQKEFLDHIQNKPNQPLSKPVGFWGGMTGGLRVNASRNVVTGTYYGSDSKLQLVDNISAQATVGYFMSKDGVPKAVVGGSGNLVIQRNYIHVRPVPNLKTALTTNWSWLWVPGFMKKLGKMIEPDAAKPVSSLEPDQISNNLDAFLEELKEGELFTITDSVGLGASVSATIPLLALLGVDPLGVGGTFTIGPSAQGTILRRTTFVRTADGLQVYLQHAHTESLSANFDFSFWMNVLKTSIGAQRGASSTRAYLLGTKPKGADEQRRMAIALSALLKANNSEILEDTYGKYVLKHEMPSKSRKAKFLRWQWSGVEESHRVEIQPPEDTQVPPRYQARDHKRKLFSHRILRRSGTNDYNFLAQVLEGFFPGHGLESAGAAGDNPSSSFLGKSRWTNITTEAETTAGRETDPVSLIEYHWQGWLLSKAKLFSIFDRIEARLASLDPELRVIDRDAFQDLKQLQMYDIQSTLLIYEKGVRRIRDDILGARKKSDRALFARLVEIEGRESFRRYCLSELQRTHSGEGSDPYAPERELEEIMNGGGWFYACLKPWMSRAMSLARKFPSDREDQVKWTAKLLHALEKDLDFGKLIEWIGKDHFFFQVRVSGFRKGQENGDSEYVSGSIGMVDPAQGVGPFKEIADQTHLTTHELYARYLSEAQ
ncbi:MAG: hypothetical protein A2X94_13420 [Bdellovibrionales bacterium GWB1_55_8]|nr:MAG: hypothetical protein A2X94_13420 [Bdellovibrionales bacterium GWB1_55_8]